MSFQVPTYDLTGKVAIITGSTRGIGNAIAKTMAHYGAAVVITGRKQDACDAVAAEIEAHGGKALGVATDVTSPEARENLVKKTVEKFGRVDILVNNAGTGGQPKKMVDMDEEYFDHYVQADYKALYFMSQAVARQMAEQGCDHQSVLCRRNQEPHRRYRVRLPESRCHPSQPHHGQRAGPLWRHGQRRGPRLCAHRYDQGRDGGREECGRRYPYDLSAPLCPARRDRWRH